VPTAELIERIRPRLEALLVEMVERKEKIDAHLQHRDEAPEPDSAERAQSMENDEVLEALDVHGLEEITAITRALRRMDEGTYETCAACSESIATRRLEALMFTELCIECAKAREEG